MLKTLGPQAANLVTALHERNRRVFTLEDVGAITGLRAASARSFIRKLVHRGVATRLKPGLFVLVPFELGREREYLGDPLLVAKVLAGERDYYLSHGTAMEIHQMVTQPRLVVYVSTPRLIRPRTVGGTEFRFVRCRRRHLFGVVPHWVTKQEAVQVSDPERTVIDGLRHPEYCGGLTEVAKGLWIQSEKLQVPRLVEYALRLGVGAVIRRLGFLLDLYEIGAAEAIHTLQRRLTSTYIALDPRTAVRGEIPPPLAGAAERLAGRAQGGRQDLSPVIPQRNLSLLSNRLARAGGRRIPEAVLERDYCLSWFLVGFSRSPLRERLLFKGGTALKKCYFPDYRFSEDLDFTLVEPVALETIRRELEEPFDVLHRASGVILRYARDDRHSHACVYRRS